MKTRRLPASSPWLAASFAAAMGLLFVQPGPARAAPRYAIVNAGPADQAAVSRLLGLYERLESPPISALAAHPAPPDTRPAAREASPARPREAPRASSRAADRAELPTAVQGKALRRALLGIPHDESLALALVALDDGRRLFTALGREAASEAFEKAIALLDRHVAFTVGRDHLVSAHTYLLVCQHELGRNEAARSTAQRLRELTADQRPAGIPQATWDAYPLVASQLLPRRTLEVKAPAEARVFLDDGLAGTGPVVLHVGPGSHRVRVEAKGHRVFVQEVPAASQAVVVPVTLVPEPEDPFDDVRKALAAVRASGKPFETEPYRGLAKTISVDFLLVAVSEGSQMRLRWFSRNLGRFSGDSFALTLPAAAAAEVETRAFRATVASAFAKAREEVRKDEELARQADKKGEDAKKSAGPQIWKKWYFWVAAAAVAGVVAAFAIKDSMTEDKVILRITRE